jgi:multidrug efflux pump subunit AcrA (membrane-fusion protein)
MEKERSGELFRPEALARLRSPDQLDKLFAPTTPVGWIALATVLLLVLSALIWSVFGTMASKVGGTGVIIDAAGVVNVTHTAGGRLREVRIKPGDRVSQGQVVAVVEQPAIEAQIARINREIASAVKSRADLAGMAANLNEQQAKLERDSQVISPVDGIVADQIVSGVGEIVAAGAPLFNIRLDEKQRGEMMVLVYVPVQEGKKVKPGMTVQIAPGSVDASEYGTLVGLVRAVSTYPVMADSITGWTGNKDLTAWIVKQGGGAVMEVKVDLIKDADTVSGYLWTSVHGAPAAITPGTVCTGNVVVKRQAPITKAFLKLNQWLRSD